jgi:hypothetical protein
VVRNNRQRVGPRFWVAGAGAGAGAGGDASITTGGCVTASGIQTSPSRDTAVPTT